MLVGFAVENFAKGALVARMNWLEAVPVIHKSQLPKVLKSHHLKLLLAQIEFGLSADEEDLVLRLRRAVVWGGRYPVATQYSSEWDEHQLADGSRRLASHFGPRDVELSEDLLVRLRVHCGEEPFKATSLSKGA
jgi:hypothetical protein